MARKALSWSKLFSKSSTQEDLPLAPEAREFVVESGDESFPKPQRGAVDLEPALGAMDLPRESAYGQQTMVQDAPPLQPEDLAAPKVSLLQKAKQATRHQVEVSGRSLKANAATLQVKTQNQITQTLQGVGPMAKKHRWTIFSVGVLLTAGGVTVGSLIWLSKVPPATDCSKIGPFSVESERLQCAQQATQSGKAEDYLKAIALVKDWPLDHPLYGRGQRSLEQWSDGLMIVARDRLAANDLDGAMKLAEQVPSSSPRYKDVRDAIGRWQEERNRGQKLFEKIQVALKQQYWEEASGLLAKLALVEDPVWQTRLTDLRRQLDNEKKAGVFLKQAQEFVKTNPAQTWGKAIEMLMAIDTKTFVWQKAQVEINKWRDALFGQAATRLSKKDIKGADEILKSLPSKVAITSDQRDLTRVVYASTVDSASDHREPIFDQMVQVLTASSQVQQVSSSSPFYKPASVLLPRLQMQVEDAMQVQIAQALASFGQVNMLQGAIAQAQGIAPKRPRRLEAQTWVARWTKGVQRLEDRPILLQAQQVAKVGSLDQLRSAVTLLDRLTKGRVLYSEAQNRRGEWVAQIQTIEDKPILNEARGLAQSGQLGKAIQVASRIKSGRALYGDAQGSIGGWAYELQAIQDRATLARAEGLASQGSLTQAIEVASQVRGGAIGGEAQSSIDRWSSERQQIRGGSSAAPPEAAPPETTYNAPEPPPPEPVYEPPASAAPPPPEPAPEPAASAPVAPAPAPSAPEAEPAPPPP
jgi:predicted Zn-dependent protease